MIFHWGDYAKSNKSHQSTTLRFYGNDKKKKKNKYYKYHCTSIITRNSIINNIDILESQFILFPRGCYVQRYLSAEYRRGDVRSTIKLDGARCFAYSGRTVRWRNVSDWIFDNLKTIFTKTPGGGSEYLYKSWLTGPNTDWIWGFFCFFSDVDICLVLIIGGVITGRKKAPLDHAEFFARGLRVKLWSPGYYTVGTNLRVF